MNTCSSHDYLVEGYVCPICGLYVFDWVAWAKQVSDRWAKLREKYGPNATRYEPEQDAYYESLKEYL